MKRFFVVFSVVLALLLVGCNTTMQTQQAEKGDFKFYSLDWGTDWETVQKNENLQNVKYEVTENGQRQLVKIEGLEYLGVKLDMAGLAFDIGELTETNGLHSVFLQFAEENEEVLLTKLTQLYGERKSTYTDKNGVENGINPAGWVSSETIEDVLTEEEKEYYINMFPKDYEQTRLDAALRSPLASIRFDEERNLIEFNGNTASVVAFIKAELQK
ncbi:MAG: hypothetical protein IJN36_05070 [Clostridia bacterium]|nr:hypothetical protein [Clostridia bacterium]MBR2883863.1 hypothetical protein [Clostridia bacterium]